MSLDVVRRGSLDALGTFDLLTSAGGTRSLAGIGSYTFSGSPFESLSWVNLVDVKAGFFSDNNTIDHLVLNPVAVIPAPVGVPDSVSTLGLLSLAFTALLGIKIAPHFSPPHQNATDSIMKTLKVGIIGGGLMGREVASALGRWCALLDFPVQVELTAVCDLVEKTREWFRQIPTVRLVTADYHELLRSDVDFVYVAVPHHLHEAIYLDVLRAGKDLFAEKPFGIDLAAARKIRETARELGRFVRCSSEFPFLPGAQKVWQFARSAKLGHVIEVRSGFWHASDLDPTKPVNWKRQNQFCGEIGVMGDLGMHAVHLPLRLGWRPKRVYAQLQKIYRERPDGKGGMAACDTWDNAQLHCETEIAGAEVPLHLSTKRLAPHEMNTWFFEVLGTERGARFSTKEPKTVWLFERRKEQVWERYDVGHSSSAFPVVTGGIFEAGFSDCFQQMWAAFVAEREGLLGDRFGCVTPDEAVASHEIFAAALRSHAERRAIEV